MWWRLQPYVVEAATSHAAAALAASTSALAASTSARSSFSTPLVIKGGGIDDFGGGSLQPLRRWRGAQWLGLALGVPSCP